MTTLILRPEDRDGDAVPVTHTVRLRVLVNDRPASEFSDSKEDAVVILEGHREIPFHLTFDEPNDYRIRVEDYDSPTLIKPSEWTVHVLGPPQKLRLAAPTQIQFSTVPIRRTAKGDEFRVCARPSDVAGLIRASSEVTFRSSDPAISRVDNGFHISDGDSIGCGNVLITLDLGFQPRVDAKLVTTTAGHVLDNAVLEIERSIDQVAAIDISAPEHMQVWWPGTHTMTLELLDQSLLPKTADKDYSVDLIAVPPGKLIWAQGRHQIIRKGFQGKFPVSYTADMDSPVVVSVKTNPGIVVTPVELEVELSPVVSGALAALAGIVGWWIRGSKPKKGEVLANICKSAACGVICFLLGQSFISLSFKVDLLRQGDPLLRACFWGFLGGGTGPAAFDVLFARRTVETGDPQK